MTKAAKTKLPSSLITLLLDRSGSMESCRSATIEAYNAYIAGLKAEQEAKIDFTFVQFDTQGFDKVHVREPIATIPDLTNATFVPRGGTPLVDAAYDTILATEKAVSEMGNNPRVVIAIQTDGQENSSMHHSFEDLTALIHRKKEEGWQFVFMGAGINAYAQATRMGMNVEESISYDHTDVEATKAAFTATGANSADYVSMRSLNTNYSMGQRMAAGDRYAKDVQFSGQPAPASSKGPLDLTSAKTAKKPTSSSNLRL